MLANISVPAVKRKFIVLRIVKQLAGLFTRLFVRGKLWRREKFKISVC
jgi:hypothetical protein